MSKTIFGISPKTKLKYSEVIKEFSSSIPIKKKKIKKMKRIKRWFQYERRGRSRSTNSDVDTITVSFLMIFIYYSHFLSFKVASGGYFLLGKEIGSIKHLSESKVCFFYFNERIFI